MPLSSSSSELSDTINKLETYRNTYKSKLTSIGYLDTQIEKIAKDDLDSEKGIFALAVILCLPCSLLAATRGAAIEGNANLSAAEINQQNRFLICWNIIQLQQLITQLREINDDLTSGNALLSIQSESSLLAPTISNLPDNSVVIERLYNFIEQMPEPLIAINGDGTRTFAIHRKSVSFTQEDFNNLMADLNLILRQTAQDRGCGEKVKDMAGYTVMLAMLGILAGLSLGIALVVAAVFAYGNTDGSLLKTLLFAPTVIIGFLAACGGFIGSATGRCYTNTPGFHNTATQFLLKNKSTFFDESTTSSAAPAIRNTIPKILEQSPSAEGSNCALLSSADSRTSLIERRNSF